MHADLPRRLCKVATAVREFAVPSALHHQCEATSDRSRVRRYLCQATAAARSPRRRYRQPTHGDPSRCQNTRGWRLTLPCDIEILSFLPHMHLRAKACRYRLTSAAGESRTLLDSRVMISFGSSFIVLGTPAGGSRRYDSLFGVVRQQREQSCQSRSTTTVRWGKQATDEMHLGYGILHTGHEPGQPLPGRGEK